MRRARRLASALLAGLVLPPASAAGQEPAGPPAETPLVAASAFLPAGHWAIAAARRLSALGLVPGVDVGSRSLTRGEAARAFEHAFFEAELEGRPEAGLARAYHRRLREEFAGARAPAVAARRGLGLGGRADAGFRSRAGELLAGTGYGGEFVDWTPPAPIEDRSGAEAGARIDVAVGTHFAATVEPRWRSDDWSLAEGYAVGTWGPVGLWAGRRAPAFGVGRGGGLLLAGDNAFDGGGIFLAEPVRLPSFLRSLGPLRFELFLGDASPNGPIEHPVVWGGRGAIAPHPRVALGLTRGAMFRSDDLTARNLLFMLIGKHGGDFSEFENQLLSLDLRYRPPLAGLPVELYVEWGLEDSAGAWRDVPGVVGGAWLPAVPGLPELSLGVERTSFARSCCGNPIWYRHLHFHGGWAEAGEPLGHPLGGHGREWLLFAGLDALAARLRVDARGFVRERGEENLFAPDREGGSTGGSIRLEYRVRPALDIIVGGRIESGEADWTRSGADVALRMFF